MIAAIDLYQHPLSGHALPTNTVLAGDDGDED